ncbi:Spt20 family-domain-containing protein [Pisolithus marmoratus]|nr:Spt20 family-domain-containing protein [Pisolithus marmoratus]
MTGYNITRSTEELLSKYESSPPSFSIHLYPDHWTLNNGPKFLYNSPVASFLDDIRAHRIPVDFIELFDSVHVPFYDGCMIVELLDYRPKRTKDPPPGKPELSRITLHPSNETLWTDLCLINQRHGSKFTDLDVLELEARILLHTAPPLCLDPDPHLTRVANHTLRVSTPTVPISLKRKAAAITQEEDETEKARRAKIMQFMNPRLNRSHTASYRILETLRRMRENRRVEAHTQVSGFAKVPSQLPQTSLPPTTQSLAAPASHTPSSQPSDITQTRQQKKPESQITITPENSRSTATPAPRPAISQLQTQTPTRSPPVNSRSPLPANSYQVPSGTPVAAHSPAQRGYTQSPRPSSSQAARSSPLASGSQLPITDHRQQPTMHFIQVAPGASHSKPATPQVGYSTLPASSPPPQQGTLPQAAQTPQHTPPQPQVQAAHSAAYPHLQRSNALQVSQSQVATQPRQQNGRATPQSAVLSRSPMVSAQALRNSPAVQNRTLAARSPMPNAASLPQQMAQSTILHPGMAQPTMTQATMAQTAQHPAMMQGTQHPPTAQHTVMAQIPAGAQLSPAYPAHYRQIPHAQHAQLQVNIPGQQGSVFQQVLDGQQATMVQYPRVYSYYGLPQGGPLYSWQGGMPNPVNGQVRGMQPGLPTQMQVVQGKTTQAGVPGR